MPVSPSELVTLSDPGEPVALLPVGASRLTGVSVPTDPVPPTPVIGLVGNTEPTEPVAGFPVIATASVGKRPCDVPGDAADRRQFRFAFASERARPDDAAQALGAGDSERSDAPRRRVSGEGRGLLDGADTPGRDGSSQRERQSRSRSSRPSLVPAFPGGASRFVAATEPALPVPLTPVIGRVLVELEPTDPCPSVTRQRKEGEQMGNGGFQSPRFRSKPCVDESDRSSRARSRDTGNRARSGSS